jgi:hypothetical protein
MAYVDNGNKGLFLCHCQNNAKSLHVGANLIGTQIVDPLG